MKTAWEGDIRQTHRHTHTRTCRLSDQLGPAGRVGEKISYSNFLGRTSQKSHPVFIPFSVYRPRTWAYSGSWRPAGAGSGPAPNLGLPGGGGLTPRGGRCPLSGLGRLAGAGSRPATNLGLPWGGGLPPRGGRCPLSGPEGPTARGPAQPRTWAYPAPHPRRLPGHLGVPETRGYSCRFSSHRYSCSPFL